MNTEQKQALLGAIAGLPASAKGDLAPVLASQLGWTVGDVRQRVMAARMTGLVSLGGWRLSASALGMVQEFEKSKSADRAVMASADGLATSAGPFRPAAVAVPGRGRATGLPGTNRQDVNTRKTIDQFAGHLAEGLSVPHAAARVGKSGDYGRAMLARIIKGLGAQAR